MEMSKPVLPQEVMLLICRELGVRREFATLFHCSIVNRRIASIAIEQLYGILEPLDPYVLAAAQNASLWRAIIMSSLGATSFPYCAYIRTLSLSGLLECLDDIRSNAALRQVFFEGQMQDFLVLQRGHEPAPSSLQRLPPLDNAAIVSKCAESIIQYAKRLADSNSTAMALTHLEASTFPRDVLPTWLSRLGALRSLQIQDGSILSMEAATAITEHCPNFSELICFHCSSDNAPEEMASFFLALRPHTLQVFEVHSRNSLKEITFAALGTHARSLRALEFRSLSASAVRAIHVLSECSALERLVVEKNPTDTSSPDVMTGQELTQVAGWVSNCKALRELEFHYVRDALPIVRQVLQVPEIHLEKLVIREFHIPSEEITKATWRAFGRQKQLRSLCVSCRDFYIDNMFEFEYPELTDSICHLHNLTSLNLMGSYVSSDDISRIASALPSLEELYIGGDLLEPRVLEVLGRLSKLTTLAITSLTQFTFDHLWRFAQSLYEVGNRRINVELLNQSHEYKLTADEESRLDALLHETLRGTFAISYPNDPDEVHEVDFSDSD